MGRGKLFRRARSSASMDSDSTVASCSHANTTRTSASYSCTTAALCRAAASNPAAVVGHVFTGRGTANITSAQVGSCDETPSGNRSFDHAGRRLCRSSAAPTRSTRPQALMKQHGCDSCHEIDKKLIGPAFRDVAVTYKADERLCQAAETKSKRRRSYVGRHRDAAEHPRLRRRHQNAG